MLDTKWAIVKRLQKGEKRSSLMKEFNCANVTVSNIKKKNKEQIVAFISTMETLSSAKVCMML